MPDRGTLQTLAPLDCYELLRQRYVGRLGYVVDGRPVIVPVNYRVDDAGGVVFRSVHGDELAAARRGDVLCLQVDGSDELYHSGWSVLVSGPAEEVTDPADLEAAADLLLRPWSSEASVGHWIRIRVDRIDGRELH